MVKPKDNLHLSLPPQSFNTDSSQEHSPVTPINRCFSNIDTSSFVTAILSPSSHDVFAARARARSRSDAPPLSSTAALSAASRAVHNSPSLDSINVARPCDTINEGDTSPLKGEADTTTVVLKPLYESPTLARRSRIRSSTGANVNVNLLDAFAPLTLHKIGENVESEAAKDDPLKDKTPSTRLLSSRPRASTLSIPSPSHTYTSLADCNLLYGSNTPSATVIYESRLRTSSHYGQSQSNINTADFTFKDAYPSLFEQTSGAHLTKITSSSNSESNIPPLSNQSSYGSLDTRYDSSLESSFAVSDLSMTFSNSLSETFDISNDALYQDHAVWRPDLSQDYKQKSYYEAEEDIKVSEHTTGASSTLSFASHSTLNIITGKDSTGRRKSHTISGIASPQCMALRMKHHEQQDVFGPTTTLELPGQGTEIQQQQSMPLATELQQQQRQLWTSKSSNQLNDSRDNKPRRLTMGGGIPTTVKGNSRSALYQSYKPNSPNKLNMTPSKSMVPILSMSDVVSSDQSAMAFQELIDAMRNERPIKSMAIEEVKCAKPESIGAVLDYRPCSPTGQRFEDIGQECQLCGSVARRLTMLEPCGHLACAPCCSSGLNQVTATPPRPHLCAACHTQVQGITLRKEGFDYSNQGSPFQTPRSIRVRPQTPSPAEQRMLFGQPKFSSPVKVLTHAVPQMKDDHRRRSASKSVVISHQMTDSSFLFGDANSSDLFTEDQSFYQSQRAMHQIQQQQHITPRRILPSIYPSPVTSPTSRQMSPSYTSSLEHIVPEPPRSTTAQGTSIIRIDNIPWTVTYNDVIEWLPQPADGIIPDTDVSSASIHIPVDVFTGKTSNCCFVECKNKEEAMRLVRHRNNHRLLDRPVSLMITTLDDLLDEIFPARLESQSLKDHECIFFTAVHLRQLVELLKKGGVQLKGPLKIVDVTTSMIRLVPANMSRVLSDMLFHRAIEIVCICIAASQEMPSIRLSLDRLLLACSNCACFSVSQRIEILDSARGTLTAVTQVKQLPTPFSVTPTMCESRQPSFLGKTPTMGETAKTGQQVAKWQSSQRYRHSSEATLLQLQQQTYLGSPNSSIVVENPLPASHHSSPQSSRRNKVATASPPRSTMPSQLSPMNMATPPRQTSLHQSPSPAIDARHLEAASQALLRYGVDGSAEGYEHMLHQVAQALAKQQVKP